MKKTSIFFLALFIFPVKVFLQQPLQPLGFWREHLPYKSSIDVTAGNNKIYCATPYSIFSVNLAENSIERMSRVTGLSETGVNAVKYDELTDKLLVVYNNSNIDILYRNDVFNVPDIKRDNITGDKTITGAFPFNKKFYLFSGLGVIVIDSDRYEVDDTWFISNTGGQVKVNGFTTDGTFFYAATAEGLKRTPVNGGNPANYLEWQMLSGTNGLPAGTCDNVIAIEGKIIVQKTDSLFILNTASWNLFFTETGWQIQNINSSAGKLMICQRRNDGNAKVTVLNPDATMVKTLQQQGLIAFPRKAIATGNDYWVADQTGGLTKFTPGGFENYKPNSPESIASGDLAVVKEIFYAAAGEVNDAWIKQLNKNGIYKFSGGQWTNYNYNTFSQMDSLPDIITLTIDPLDESIWAGSYGGGMVHIKEGNIFEIFKQNSAIGQAFLDPGSYRVSGLAFDQDNNLWISNYGSSQQIVVRKKDGNWKNFTVPFALVENATAQIVIDDENQKWIVSPKGNGLIYFHDGNTIDNTADDKWKLYRFGAGNGNLPSNNVLSIAKDKNGFILIGTDDGIGIVQCPQDVFSLQGCDAVLPVVQQGNFNSYLFKGEKVQSIVTDGADRKWIATTNGAWLISSDGEKVINHFTGENSFLLSNDVKKIAIDGKSGEIYFATAKGICSFRGSATEGGVRNVEVLVFPNPVPPGYTGIIAIRGLVNNALVKITELDGRLVYQSRASGGQLVWDGRDYKRRKISSGVYLVLVTDDTRKENLATKIVFINSQNP